jgi:hypothetical protein
MLNISYSSVHELIYKPYSLNVIKMLYKFLQVNPVNHSHKQTTEKCTHHIKQHNAQFKLFFQSMKYIINRTDWISATGCTNSYSSIQCTIRTNTQQNSAPTTLYSGMLNIIYSSDHEVIYKSYSLNIIKILCISLQFHPVHHTHKHTTEQCAHHNLQRNAQ